MEISVVIPVWNRARYLGAAIASVLGAGHESLEIVVVDDGSEDGSLDVANTFKKRYPDRLHVLRHPGGVHRGIAASRNLGIERGQGSLIAFLDSDDLYLPGRFDASIRLLEERPELLGAYGRVIDVEERFLLPESRISVDLSEYKVRPACLPGATEQTLSALLWKRGWWAMPAVTLRRQALGEFGFFNEKLAVGEDTDLWLRLAATGRMAAVSEEATPVAVVRRHNSHSWDGVAGWRRELLFIEILAKVSAIVDKDAYKYAAGASNCLRQKVTESLYHVAAAARGRKHLVNALEILEFALFYRPSLLRSRRFWGDWFGIFGNHPSSKVTGKP